jgi:hypothetical protein
VSDELTGEAGDAVEAITQTMLALRLAGVDTVTVSSAALTLGFLGLIQNIGLDEAVKLAELVIEKYRLDPPEITGNWMNE